MAERPRILRSLRALDAAALAACAAALFAAPARASVFGVGFADPSVDGDAVALHAPGANGVLRSPGATFRLPGTHPAIGGGRQAWIAGDEVTVGGVATISAPGANALAVSADWVAWRAGGALWAASLQPGDAFAVPRLIVTGDPGPPALTGRQLLATLDRGTRIYAFDLTTGVRTLLRQARDAQVRGPSSDGVKLAYVYATYKRQQVRVGWLAPGRAAADRTVYGMVPTGRRDAGEEKGHHHAPGHTPHLWPRPPAGVSWSLTTTALSADSVYVTRLRQTAGHAAVPVVLRLPR
jgi:hypothetical protein